MIITFQRDWIGFKAGSAMDFPAVTAKQLIKAGIAKEISRGIFNDIKVGKIKGKNAIPRADIKMMVPVIKENK